jgi:2-methylcitrate dehydratase PrpD
MHVTKDIADFAARTDYEDLPLFVVQETKRLLLDTMGCAIGGLSTQKGKIAIHLARSLGGPAEATILGTGDKVSGASSAFAAGELINALDYEALLSPPDHATPYVLPAPLAIGETKRVSGKELIIATAVAHELATRIGSSLIFGRRFAVELPERGVVMSLPTPPEQRLGAGCSVCLQTKLLMPWE